MTWLEMTVISAVYLRVAYNFAYVNDDYGMAWAFICYALANIGFLLRFAK